MRCADAYGGAVELTAFADMVRCRVLVWAQVSPAEDRYVLRAEYATSETN